MRELIDILGDLTAVSKTDANWPVWLQAKKQQAGGHLSDWSLPNRKMEIWRYADVARLSRQHDVGESGQAEVENVEGNKTQIVVSDADFSVNGDQPSWLMVKRIDQVSEADWQAVDPMVYEREQLLLNINQAAMHGGIYLEVSANHQDPEHVIEILYVHEGQEWQQVRNQFVIGANSQVTIKEVRPNGRINQVTHWQVQSGAAVKHLNESRLSDAAVLVQFDHFDLYDQAQFTAMNHHYNGALQHHQRQVVFHGEGAHYTSGSVNKTNDNNNICDIVNVFHNEKNNQSDVTHRSIAKDQSQIFNNAKALVAPGADQSEINQDLKNILLSEDAKIFSKPELEVYADEVVAAHGSTIGALDEQSLFYLQSRGIDIEQARDIMIESFEQEAVVC